MPFNDRGPSATVDGDGRFQFGTWRVPLDDPDFSTAALSDCPAWWGNRQKSGLAGCIRSFRLKEWHYHSVAWPQGFLGVAVAQLHYVANVFVYLVDRQSGQKHEFSTLIPLGRNVTMASSSIHGRTSWEQPPHHIGFVGYPDRWHADIAVSLAGRSLQAEFDIWRDEALALLYPLHDNRAAYTHKEAGNRVDGRLTFDGTTTVLDGSAYGTIDWTRSFANRSTRWNWLSVGGRLPDGSRLGLNLSEHVYGEAENGVWRDGRVTLLGPVHFTVPKRPLHEPWRIQGASVDLTFQPDGARRENVELGIIASKFVQCYGMLSGTVQTPDGPVAIETCFGVVEDHSARW